MGVKKKAYQDNDASENNRSSSPQQQRRHTKEKSSHSAQLSQATDSTLKWTLRLSLLTLFNVSLLHDAIFVCFEIIKSSWRWNYSRNVVISLEDVVMTKCERLHEMSPGWDNHTDSYIIDDKDRIFLILMWCKWNWRSLRTHNRSRIWFIYHI
jgi:hypothetical protein